MSASSASPASSASSRPSRTVRTLGRALSVAFLALGAAAFAQYSGPVEGKTAPEPLRTVAEIRDNAKDDRPVLLTGTLAKKVGKEKYLFKDATGEIRVEIDAEDFPAGTVDEKTRVEIAGETDKSALRAIEVDAKRVRVLSAN